MVYYVRIKYSLLQTIHKRLADFKEVFSEEHMSTMQRAAALLKKRQITINLFASCNIGKSTLLNAILGEK